jgi:hypothetical protein
MISASATLPFGYTFVIRSFFACGRLQESLERVIGDGRRVPEWQRSPFFDQRKARKRPENLGLDCANLRKLYVKALIGGNWRCASVFTA